MTTAAHTPSGDASRRAVLTAAGAALITSASTTSASAEPTPAIGAPRAEFVYEAIVTLGAPEEVGHTPFGKRVRIPITGGTFAGPLIRGSVFPQGMDWQLIRPDGFTTIEASYLMRTDDGVVIHIHNKGVAGKDYVMTTPVFEAPDGRYAWLNEAVFVGTLGPAPETSTPAVRIRVFKLV